jgi:hypothetical protein
MPNPHRISLARAWTTRDSSSASFQLQRHFQTPTGLCPETIVRLRIQSPIAIEQVDLNGEPLCLNSTLDEQNAQQVAAENLSEFVYDWEITAVLTTRNELVVTWPPSDPLPPIFPPKFEVWLEIFAP